MEINKITPQIAGMLIGQKCENSAGSIYTVSNTDIYSLTDDAEPWRKLTVHLRRLESMTEEEARELYEGCDNDDFYTWYKWLVKTRLNNMLLTPSALLYLVSKGFDVLGLIDKGLAKEIKP